MKTNFSSYTKKDNRTHGFTAGKTNGIATFYRVGGVEHAFVRTSQVFKGAVAEKLHTMLAKGVRSSGYTESRSAGRSRKKRTYGK